MYRLVKPVNPCALADRRTRFIQKISQNTSIERTRRVVWHNVFEFIERGQKRQIIETVEDTCYQSLALDNARIAADIIKIAAQESRPEKFATRFQINMLRRADSALFQKTIEYKKCRFRHQMCAPI